METSTSRHLLPPDLQARATVVVNGADIDRFGPGAETADTGPLRCVYVSSFRSWHGAEDLVAAVAHCAARHVPLQVTCIGEGPRWKLARAAAAAAGVIRARGIFMGMKATSIPCNAFTSSTHSVTPAKKNFLPPRVTT